VDDKSKQMDFGPTCAWRLASCVTDMILLQGEVIWPACKPPDKQGKLFDSIHPDTTCLLDRGGSRGCPGCPDTRPFDYGALL